MKQVVLFVLACLVGSGCGPKKADGPGAMPSIQVVAVAARRQPVSETLSLVGSTAPNEMVEIKAEADGIVQDINFAEGQEVKKGHLLVVLDETRLAAAVAEAGATLKLSQANYERTKQLFRDQLLSQQEYDQAAATFAVNQATVEFKQRQLKDARVYAPFAGTIGARNISPGQVITRNTTLTWLVDLDPVKVEINVPERFLSQLQVGQSLDISVATFPGRKFTGKVYFIAPQVDSATRTTLVKAEVPNPKRELKGGMFANLDLTLTIRENAVVIPEAALTQLLEGGLANIFTVGEDNTVRLTQVRIGVRLAGQVEILEGLQGGEKVVVEGTQKISPGVKVKLAPPEAAAPYLKGG